MKRFVSPLVAVLLSLVVMGTACTANYPLVQSAPIITGPGGGGPGGQ